MKSGRRRRLDLHHITDVDFTIRPRPRGEVFDLEEVYEGKDGFAGFAQDWSDVWSRSGSRSILDRERVLTLLTHVGTGRASGVDVTEDVGHLVRFNDGPDR